MVPVTICSPVAGATILPVFLPGFGNDAVTGFRVGNANNHDTLDLSGLGFDNLQDVLANTTDVGSDAVITSGTDTITVVGVTEAQLEPASFDLLVWRTGPDKWCARADR